MTIDPKTLEDRGYRVTSQGRIEVDPVALMNSPAVQEVWEICGEIVRLSNKARERRVSPAQPEPKREEPAPVAGELAEEVACASYHLHRIGERAAAYALETWARSQATAQPEQVQEKVYHHPDANWDRRADCGAMIGRGDSMPEWNHVTCPVCHGYRIARGELERDQAASAQPKAVGVPVAAIKKALSCLTFAWMPDNLKYAEEIDRWLAAVEGGK